MTHSFFYWYITDYSGEGFDVNQDSPFPPAVPSRTGHKSVFICEICGTKKSKEEICVICAICVTLPRTAQVKKSVLIFYLLDKNQIKVH